MPAVPSRSSRLNRPPLRLGDSSRSRTRYTVGRETAEQLGEVGADDIGDGVARGCGPTLRPAHGVSPMSCDITVVGVAVSCFGTSAT